MNKNSPLMMVLGIIVIIGVLYGGYRIVRHLNKTNIQAPYQQSVTASPSANTSPVAMMSKEMKITLTEENKSGESGTAALKEENGKTTVTLALAGFEMDVAQPAHIHAGACPGVGAVKYPLTNVVNGSSITVLNVTIDQLKKGLPLAINVHKSATSITNYTSCGELSAQ